MGIDGISGPKPVGLLDRVAIDQSSRSMDRDPQQGSNPYNKNKKKEYLLDNEQEKHLLEAINSSDGFKASNMTAYLMKEEGKPAHFVIKHADGEVAMHLSYQDAVDNYLHSNDNGKSGLILRRSA